MSDDDLELIDLPITSRKAIALIAAIRGAFNAGIVIYSVAHEPLSSLSEVLLALRRDKQVLLRGPGLSAALDLPDEVS